MSSPKSVSFMKVEKLSTSHRRRRWGPGFLGLRAETLGNKTPGSEEG